MTLDEVRRSEKEMLSPKDIAPILGVHPYSINVKARKGTLEFKSYFSGNRCKIPRIPFLKFMDDQAMEGDDVN